MLWCLSAWVAGAAPPEISPLEAALVDELDRAWADLGASDEPPHYVSLAVQDWEQITLSARDGTLATDDVERARLLDVDLRTGTPELDSTHPLRGFSALTDDSRGPVQIPLDDGYALRHAVWAEIDARYRSAAEKIVVLRANRNVKVEEEDPAPDFEPREAVVDRAEVPPLVVDHDAWAERVATLSEHIERSPAVHRSAVTLQGDRGVTTFVDTEGTRLVHGRRHLRVSMMLQSTASDGDEVTVFLSKDAHDPEKLPTDEELQRWADEAVAQLDARLAAPRAEPTSGPVLLTGRAAAVFFHEVLGHRVEGQRQKREDEGKTFADQVGQQVLPTWLDVVDDPRIDTLAGEQLNGFYTYDDEGVPGQEAVIVDDGVFRGFLLYRSPIPGFPHSNGHGRRSTGNAAEARMGNTIIRAKGGQSMSQLRAKLIALARQQGLPYGYVVDEIEGGFTMTGRVTPNAFNVRASTTWRVYVDGRPDELVRGIDLVGTPLVAFSNIVAAGDEPQVFNGVCGSDSGWVPVSAVSPAMLFGKLEFQLKEK
ncbi:MAG: TldD/PmbA family protein, partial [Myxococcales bacterium]|nr:TldD/PmbA family protein [Myxococcales bacterium]